MTGFILIVKDIQENHDSFHFCIFQINQGPSRTGHKELDQNKKP